VQVRPRILVEQHERLLRSLVVGLDRQRVGVESDEAAVADELRPVLVLVEVAEDVEVSLPHLVPLTDRLERGDEDAADAALIVDRVAVMKPQRLAVDVA
jgi:hypothetical protein